jgi:hypothetical protein
MTAPPRLVGSRAPRLVGLAVERRSEAERRVRSGARRAEVDFAFLLRELHMLQ